MNEVRGLLEEALAKVIAEELAEADVACPVVKGDAEGERPDEYVAVVAGTADSRGVGNYLVQAEIRVVGPVDDAIRAAGNRKRLRVICDYLDAANCPFRTLETDALRVAGYHLAALDSQKGTRSRAEIVRLKIGARAVVDTET